MGSFFTQMTPRVRNSALAACTVSIVALSMLYSQKTELVPSTPQAVTKFVKHAEKDVLSRVDQLVSIPDGKQTVENTLRPWNRLANQLVVDFGMLTFLTTTDLPSKAEAELSIQNLQGFLSKSLVENPQLLQSMMMFAHASLNNKQPLSPYENYQIFCLLESCDGLKNTLSLKDQESLEVLKVWNGKQEKKPYIYLKSNTPEKVATSEELPLNILTLNACFTPGNYPYLFGGVFLPWEKRIEPLAKKILEVGADIVCLQEVHAEDATYALYAALKNDYTYFYGAIGPRVLGFSLNTLGFPSGLFVASKYPIEKPEFTLFKASGFPMNYGFFDFIVKSEDKALAHVYTTHLQSLNYPHFSEIRALQLKQLLEKMESDVAVQQQPLPYFLCGDLNIPLGSKEPGEALLQAHFYDAYNKNQTPICETNRTCTNFFTNFLLSPNKKREEIEAQFEILDYALLLHSLPNIPVLFESLKCEIETRIVSMGDLEKPEQAISDHQGLLTSLKKLRLK